MLYFLSKHLYLTQLQINILILHAQCFNPRHNYDSHYVLHTCEVKVAQSCPTLCDPMDYTVRGIPQARVLEWVAYPLSGKPLYTYSVQFSRSVVSSSLQPHGLQHARPPCPSPTPRAYPNSCPLSRWCHPTISSSVIPFSSSIRVFSNESALCIRWPKYWSFRFNISPSKEHSGQISFRISWFNLLAVQGTHKSLLQHCSSKPSMLWHAAFFIVQLSHPYMTTGKTIALTRQTLVGKVMSLLFNMLLGLSQISFQRASVF